MKKSIAEIRQKTKNELIKESDTLRNEIAKLVLEVKVNKPKDTNIIGKKRKRLAVVLTLIKEKQE